MAADVFQYIQKKRICKGRKWEANHEKNRKERIYVQSNFKEPERGSSESRKEKQTAGLDFRDENW